MGIRLLVYLLLLLAGAILGYKDKINPKLTNRLNTIQSISLFFLLFTMGNRMGLDQKVINSFFSIGYKAGVVAIVTIIVTIVISKILSRFVILKGEGNEIER